MSSSTAASAVATNASLKPSTPKASVSETIAFYKEASLASSSSNKDPSDLKFLNCFVQFYGKSHNDVYICFACCEPSKVEGKNSCAGCWSPAKHDTDKRLFYGRHTINYERLMSYYDSNDAKHSVATSSVHLFDVEDNYTGALICDNVDDSLTLASFDCHKACGKTLYKVSLRDIGRKYTQFLRNHIEFLEHKARSLSRRPHSSSRKEVAPSRSESRPPRSDSRFNASTRNRMENKDEDSGKQKQSSSSSGRAKSRSNR